MKIQPTHKEIAGKAKSIFKKTTLAFLKCLNIYLLKCFFKIIELFTVSFKQIGLEYLWGPVLI